MEWLKSIDMDAKTLALLELGMKEESSYFKLRVHERLEELEKEMGEWAEVRLAQFNRGDELVRKGKEHRIALLAFAFWPNVCDPQRAATLSKLMYWIFLFDDVVDGNGSLRLNSHQAAHLASKLLHAFFGRPLDHYGQNISSPEELLLVEVGLEWWREIESDLHVSTTQRVRFETMFSEYLLSQVPFTRLSELIDTKQPPSVEEYVPLRSVSAAIPLCLLMTEYQLGIELDNETFNHPLIKQLCESIAIPILGVNDCRSFPREILQCEFMNLFALLHIHNNTLAHQAGQALVPFHVAISQAWEMMNSHERECVHLVSLILKSPLLASKPNIKEYVEALCGFIPANRAWCFQNKRYTYTPRASCPLESFPHAHRIGRSSPVLDLARRNNPHQFQLKNSQYLKGIQCFRGRRFDWTLSCKDMSLPLLPKLPSKSVPSSSMTLGG